MTSVYKPRYGNAPDPDRCAASVADRGRTWRAHQCRRKGILEHDGHKWCKQHYPPNVDAREKAWQEAFDAKWAAMQERSRKARVATGFIDVLRQIAAGHNNPRQIAQDILDEYDGKGE